jgi:uncharacterized membrane protein
MKNMLTVSKPQTNLWFKSEVEYWLAVSVMFSIALAIAGSIFSGRFILGFLIWNLFLGFVPYAISRWMQRNIDWNRNKLVFCVCLVGWLLFIPNSFYIITDLFHLGSFNRMPLWFELTVILSFAWNGLLLGVLSVHQIEKLITGSLSRRARLVFIYPVMFLNALGVYIGRYMRFNSWDVITNPFTLVNDIAELALHPIEYKYAWGMVFCFSIFMTLLFFTLISAKKEGAN